MQSIKEDIRNKALEIGFSTCNFCSSDILFDKQQLTDWYARGYAADMQWLSDNIDLRTQPQKIFTESKTIISCGLNYYQEKPVRHGDIARYALGRDYHKVLQQKLKLLIEYIQKQYNGNCISFVDTAPILERPIAQKSGCGWIGKSSLLVNKHFGKYLFLGELFTSLSLEPDNEHTNYCGSCTKCIASCPTGAIVDACTVDANKCIAYHTIENKGAIPTAIRKAIGNRLYGCDTCTDVCVWNKFSKSTNEPDFAPRKYPDVRELLQINETQFSKLFAGSPIHRIKLERLQRNACVVLGNTGHKTDIPLLKLVVDSNSPLVAEHAQWAINQIINGEQRVAHH